MRRQGRGGCLLFGAVCLLAGIWWGASLPEQWRSRIPGERTTPTPTPTPTPEPPTPTPKPTERPLPERIVIPPHSREVARLYNGIQVRSAFEVEPDGRLASQERETPADYALDLRLQIKAPAPAKTLADLSASAPTLATQLLKLPKLLETAEVSKFYYGIYQLKTDLLRQSLTHLDSLLAPDVFYDTETVLELRDPDTQRRALLIQTDMDVDTDGSDADRLADVDASDPDFQALTSYKWPKRGAVPNPLLRTLQDRLAKVETDERDPRSTPGKRRDAMVAADDLRVEIAQVQRYSSLIAKTDPYIVLPGFMTRQAGHPFQPKLGDYAIVLAGDRMYPAIFGDIGPSYKLGEASLRIAQTVDPRASAQRSPVNDLKITYIVFPGSADLPAGPPDLTRIKQRCQALLDEIGGGKTPLYEWANLIPSPTPIPTPTPRPTPTLAPQGPTGAPSLNSSPAPTVVPTPAPTLKPS